MSTLIVTESIFGNTLAIAEAIASGITEVTGPGTVTLIHASAAPNTLPEEVDLVIVGAPTHTLALPDAGTRALAASGIAIEPEPLTAVPVTTIPTVGVREWIDQVDLSGAVRVATFDTSIPAKRQLGTAARAAAVALRQRGVTTTVGPSFDVTGMEGPLADGELGRATAWGRTLAASA